MRVLSHCLFILLLSFSAFGQNPSDVKGAKDHPMISRFPGAVIRAYSPPRYDEAEFPFKYEKSFTLSFSKTIHTEGKITRILYLFPKDVSLLEVYRNYERALKQKGFSILYWCRGKDGCGVQFGDYIFAKNRQPEGLYYSEREALFKDAFIKDLRYFLAKLNRPEKGDVYVSLTLAYQNNDSSNPNWARNRVVGYLEVVETKPIPTGKVNVSLTPKQMAQAIQSTGHVALYNIYFDFNKADLKPESEPALKAIAQLMKQDPNLKLYVVGHTDAQGTLAYNLELSKRRAQAVVDALVKRYGIPAARLQPYGVGPLAPVASNDTDEGRAKNRRVELVKQ